MYILTYIATQINRGLFRDRSPRTYLHDGRASTLDQAILAHDGQARGARDGFAALAADAKAKLIAFLNSL
ncbi:MAG TPA: di-heme oxidoredictase family protein [Thermoanaerobaculia bacterium]|jgi:CxxC motif-containing protein (DUF1111 family)|nr:di-heme oxidoredictase family protein [Thermoanaerobaculia bacterium]